MSLTEEHDSDVGNELDWDREDGEKEKAVSVFWALNSRCINDAAVEI
jgi:hypothetical protein